MSKQAKITLGLDIKPLKQATSEAKKALEDLGNVKLDKEISKAFRKEIFSDATQQVKIYKSMLQAATGELKTMSQANDKAWDHGRAQKLVVAIRQYRDGLKEAQAIARSSNSILPAFGGGGAMGGAGAAGSKAFGGIKGGLASMGIGLGVGMAMSRAIGQAKQSMELRQISGGSTVGSGSQYGFTRDERRDRAMEISRGVGRRQSEQELTKNVNMGETMERAFGISGGQMGQAMGAARKAGVKDEGKFVADTIGDAVATGLSGSSVGEYLSEMTGYMQSLSKGINVDDKSIRGFAAGIGSLDFFKSDPARIFEIIGKLEQGFSGGDQYQQFAAYRSFQGATGIDNVHSFGVKQQLGLFGGDDKLAGELGALDGLGYTGGANLKKATGKGSGGKIANEMLKTHFMDAMAGGNDLQQGANVFMKTTNMKQGGLEIFKEFARQWKAGKGEITGVSAGMIDKAQQGMMSPEEMAKKNMDTLNGSVLNFGRRVDDLKNIISDTMAQAVTTFASAVDSFASLIGVEGDLTKAIMALAAAQGLKGGLGGLGGGGAGKLGPGGLLGVGAAALIGNEIGEAIRAKLNEWTNNDWDAAIDKFWSKAIYGDQNETSASNNELIGKDRHKSIMDYATSRGVDVAGSDPEPMQKRIDTAVKLDKHKSDSRRGKINRLRKQGRTAEADALESAPPSVTSPQDIEKWISTQESKPFGFVQTRDSQAIESSIIEDTPLPADTGADPLMMQHGGRVYMQNGGALKLAEIKRKGWRGFGRHLEKYDMYNEYIDGEGNHWSRSMLSGDYSNEGKPKEGTEPYKVMSQMMAGRRKQHGGVIRLQHGGGVDSVPAMLTPGEFVVNAGSSSKNMNALVHANSGGLIQPVSPDARGGGGGGGIDLSALDMSDPENTGAVMQNTAALLQLAQSIQDMAMQREAPRGGAMRLGF